MFVFPFDPIAKEKKIHLAFLKKNERQIKLAVREKDVKFISQSLY